MNRWLILFTNSKASFFLEIHHRTLFHDWLMKAGIKKRQEYASTGQVKFNKSESEQKKYLATVYLIAF